MYTCLLYTSTQNAVYGLLARLHLNAAVYRDIYADNFTFAAADMDKVIEYCDKIIASNQYKLSACLLYTSRCV